MHPVSTARAEKSWDAVSDVPTAGWLVCEGRHSGLALSMIGKLGRDVQKILQHDDGLLYSVTYIRIILSQRECNGMDQRGSCVCPVGSELLFEMPVRPCEIETRVRMTASYGSTRPGRTRSPV